MISLMRSLADIDRSDRRSNDKHFSASLRKVFSGSGGYQKVLEFALRRGGGGLIRRFFSFRPMFSMLCFQHRRQFVWSFNRRGRIPDRRSSILFSAPSGQSKSLESLRLRTGGPRHKRFRRLRSEFFEAGRLVVRSKLVAKFRVRGR